MKFSHSCRILALVFGALLSPLLAVETFYIGANGDWTSAVDWTNGQAGTGDRANVNGDLLVNVTTDVGIINSLRVGTAGNSTNGAGTLIIDGATSLLTVQDGGGTGVDVIIGSGAFAGTLQLKNGGTLTANNLGNDGEIFVGQSAGSNGILLLDGGTINANRGLYVAAGAGDATGTATIGDSAGVGDAILNVQGGNLEVGTDGVGTMTVLSDGIVNINSNNLVIGQTGTSNGHVILNGGTINFHAAGDLNMNSGVSQFTINAGSTITGLRTFNQSSLEGTPSTANLNGGVIALSGDFVDRNGLSTINYNGTQLVIGGNDLSTTTMNVGTAAAAGAVTMNIVASGTSVGQGDVEANTVIVYRGLTISSAGVDATINVNNGFLEVRRGIAGGGGNSTLNVGTAGTLGQLFIEGVNPLVDVSSQISSLSVGANGTLNARPNLFNVNPIDTVSADLTGGTLTIDNSLITAAASTSPNFETIWVGGSTVWDGAAGQWSRGLPSGYTINSDTQMTVVNSASPIVGSIGFSTADWTLVSDGTAGSATPGQLIVSNDLQIDAGATRAVLRGTAAANANVVRNSALVISNSNSAGAFGATDAAHLEIMDNATLTVNGDVYVGGVAEGTVDQSGGMTINGNLYFGQNPTGGDQGGTWNLNSGETLTVSGSIVERAVSTNNAQFYIRGGTLDVAGDITVQRLDLAAGSGQNSTLDLKPGQTVTSTGTTQIGAGSKGQINITDATSVLQAANMTIGGGNFNDSTLNVTAGIGGTNGGSLTFGTNTGNNSGPRILVSGTGIVRVGTGSILDPATGNADLIVNNGRTNDISVTGSGLLDIGRDFLLHNSTATAGGIHQLNVVLADSATINVGRHLNFRAGTTTFKVQGGTLAIGGNLLLNAGTSTFRVEGGSSTITVGGAVTQTAGQLFQFAPTAGGITPIQVTGATAVNGDFEIDASGIANATTAVATLTTWNAGSVAWTGSDAEWLTSGNRMINPDGAGALQTNDRFTVIQGGAASVTGVPTSLTADWTVDNTTDTSKVDIVYGGATVNSLPLHAVLTTSGGPISIGRSTDLTIAPVLGNSASALTINTDVTLDITDGLLDGAGPSLLLGSATEYGDVIQNGGTVNVDGVLGFGVGAGSKGGYYYLNGGTLNVFGDVVEGGTGGVDTSVDTAQLYINGGSLNVSGANINVQSLRTGQAAGSNATVSFTNKAVGVSGELHVGEEGTGVMNLLGTTNVTASTWFYIGTAATGNGTVNVGDGFDSPVITVSSNDLVVGESGTGTMIFQSGQINSTGGFHLANQTSGNGSLTVGTGGSSPVINNSGGNFETANNGTGVVTWNSGTLNQTTNNLIVGQGGTSNATFTLKAGLIDLENQLRMNAGVGVVNQEGGTMNVGTRLDMVNSAVDGISMTYNISGGILNIGDRAVDDLVIGNTANSTSTADFNQSGGTVNVARHIFAGNAADGNLDISGTTSVVNVGYDHGTTQLTDGGARIFVGYSNPGTSTATLTSGTVNVGGGIWAGTNGGATGDITVGSNGGAAADTTIRVGILGADGNAETRIGNSGAGSFTLESGRYFQETQNFVVANGAGSTGSVIVNSGELNVGYDQPTMTSNTTSDLAFGAGTGGVTQNGGTVRVADKLIFTPVSEATYNAVGGITQIGGSIEFASDTGGKNALNISGGSVSVGGDINYGSFGDDRISLTSGSLNFTQPGGGTINVSNARDGFTFSGGTLQNLGTLNGYNPATAPEVANLGSNPSDAFLINGAELSFSAGKVGNSLTFDSNLANNEAVSFVDDRFGNPTALTVSIWFNRSQDNSGTANDTNHFVNNVLMAQSSGPTNDNFEIGSEGNNLEIYFDTTTGGNPANDMISVDLTTLGGIVNGDWNHLVFTYDKDATDGRMKIFFNGSQVTTFDQDAFNGPLASASGTTTIDSPFSLGIARPDSSSWGDFSGQLDEFAAWNTVISASDVAALYNSGNGSNSASILASAVIYAPLEQQMIGNLETFTQTGGIFAPGLATGSFTDMVGASNVNANYDLSAGTWAIDLISNGGVQNDFVDVNGALTLGGSSVLTLNLLDWTSLTTGDVFVVGEYNTLNGTFGTVDLSQLLAQLPANWQIDYNYLGGNQIAILVPEPSRMVLLGMGFSLLFLRRRRPDRAKDARL